MKKLLLLIVPVVFFITACDNKVAAPAEPVVILDTIYVHDTIYVTSPVKVKGGAPGMPAQVFDDITLAAIKGVTVVAKRESTTVETVTTDVAGHYEYTRLVGGTSYTYTASKTGYKTQTLGPKVYEGIASLPEFRLKK